MTDIKTGAPLVLRDLAEYLDWLGDGAIYRPETLARIDLPLDVVSGIGRTHFSDQGRRDGLLFSLDGQPIESTSGILIEEAYTVFARRFQTVGTPRLTISNVEILKRVIRAAFALPRGSGLAPIARYGRPPSRTN